MRYVALVVQDQTRWVVLFPDFPDLAVAGPILKEALRRARRELSDRIAILHWKGTPIPAPMSAAALMNAPCYWYSMPAIIVVPDPRRGPEDSDMFHFGGR